MVLARLPDAPPGSRGLSLFLTSKREVAEDGALGAANALRPASLEHKLGVHASPTCVMLFEAPGPNWSALPTRAWRRCS